MASDRFLSFAVQSMEPIGRTLVVAVDFSKASITDRTRLRAQSGRPGELFHAISTANEGKLRYAEVSDQAIAAYRKECMRYARDRMFWLTDTYDARRNRVQSVIGRGNPARQVLVQQERSGAELIVVGKHPASATSDFLFGNTAQGILRDSAIDVLVVPHDSQASGAGALGRWVGPKRRCADAGRAPQAPGAC